MSKSRTPLNPREEKFCQEYLAEPHLNGTKAAIKAGYSKKTAGVKAAQLLVKISIRQRIKELQIPLQKKTEVTQEMVIEELRRLAFGDRRNIVYKKGHRVYVTDSDKLSIEDAACIESMEKTKTGIKINTSSKEKALELLSRHLGMYDKDSRGNNTTVIMQPTFNCTPETVPLVQDLLAGKKPDGNNIAESKQPDAGIHG